MEKVQDGFDQQVAVLVKMLGITRPSLRQQATELLRDALKENPNSAISNGCFFGRLKKLLFKKVPKKPKTKPQSHPSPVTPPIVRGDSVSIHPTIPTVKRGPPVVQNGPPAAFDGSGRYQWHDDEEEEFDSRESEFYPAPDYANDIITEGAYNSRGQRIDEDGDVVRDVRVYMCENAIHSFTKGTAHITDTYDLYALVQCIDIDLVPEAIEQLLTTGVYHPTHSLQLDTPVKLAVDAAPGPRIDDQVIHCTAGSSADQSVPPNTPTTYAATSAKRNLIAHYIRTIALPPQPEVDLPRNVRRQLVHDRGKQEKARLRQLRLFLKALNC